MPDTYDDIIAAATSTTGPTRTRKGALKFQPADTDWSLDRLPELQDYFQSTYKRPLPLTVKGQGSIHNKLGYDHRASADISLHPNTDEGRSLIAELQRRNIPFLAFEGAIPGASTGPHIHVGRPSHHITNKFPVGSQVKGVPKRQATDDYSDVIAAATGGAAQPKPAQSTAPKSTGPLTLKTRPAFGTALPTAAVAAGVRDDDIRQRTRLAAAVDEYERGRTGSSNIGELRRADEAALEPYRRTTAEVRRERAVKRGLGMPVAYNPITAVQEYLAGEERVVREETDRRMQAGYQETERLREIASQFTDADRQQLANVHATLSGGSPVQRGIATGTWRVGSGLLYKLAAISDLATSIDEPGKPSVLGEYLRRKAAVGEIAVNELESELPPPLRQELANFVTHSVLAIPEMAGAVTAGGPIAGFAALGGLETAGRKQPLADVMRETAKGAVIGGVFAGAGAFESGAAERTFAQRAADTAQSGVAIGLGTAAVEKAFGATDEEALTAPASNVVFHVGMRVPGEVGRLAQAAEKAYVTPPDAPRQTVPDALQEKLLRTEVPPAAETPPAAHPADTVVTGSAEVVPPRTPAGAWRVRIPLPDGTISTESFPTEAEANARASKTPAPTTAPPPESLTPTVPPADMTLQPPTSAVPAVDAATAPTAPSLERRGPTRMPDADWLELTPEERTRVRQEVDLEQAALSQEAEPVTRRPLAEVMRERMEVGPIEPAPERHTKQQRVEERRKSGEGGFIDLNEIREGLKAGKIRTEEAIEQLGKRFRNSPPDRLKVILNRDRDPLIGIVGQEGVLALDNPNRAMTHSIVFRESLKRSPAAEHWRYEPIENRVYWNDLGSPEARAQVVDYLNKRGLEVKDHRTFGEFDSRLLWEKEIEAMNPPHHATQQPRTPTGQFDIGAPGGPEAARSQLRSEAIKYREQFGALDRHAARREGLDIVNDDVAHNYFSKLRRMVDEHLPAQSAKVDQAESLYNQGKYGQATMLAESIFQSLPDKVNQYAGAEAALQLIDRGLTPRANWSKVLQEVRTRLQRTGGLSGGGSTFYDVNKYPEGGRPDHSKIAYILEPVIEALKADASHLIAVGKLKAADYTAHIRTEVNKMLQGPEFSDWHPLNKSAALGVLVDKLRRDGPPMASEQRQRSLPKTLEKSGRDPGTNTTYDRLPNAQVNERVEARLASEGADALETWYRNAPESADRTAAHRVLVDHYTAEATKLADTAPQRAETLYQRARDLSNLEAERATTLGQAVQLYSNLLKYSPAGVTAELARMERAGVKVPAEVTAQLTKTAQEHQRLDSEVRRLERQVAEAEAAESGGPPPEGATARPRQYRPRSDTVIDSKTERIRRQLDEAAKRRRAAKAAIASQLRALEAQRTVPGYLKRINNITRGLMVSAFSTAIRNFQTQLLRFDIERLTDTVDHTMRRAVGLDSDLSYRNIWRNATRQFRPGQTAEAKQLLTGHPGEYQRMFNAYAGGVEMPIPGNARGAVERTFQTVERGVEIANIFNRIQEFHVRSAEFLAELDLHLRKEKNLSLEKFVDRNGIDAVPLDLIRKGVDKALEVTFADMPLRDGAGGRFLTSMIEVGNYIPPTLSPVAFPRFMFNNLKFLYQYSPAGMIDLARKNQNKPRVIARSLVGTSMLLLAYQFRNSDHAGEKWYELKLGDTTLDARPFGPFSTYLFFAEAYRRWQNGEKAFTVEEIAGAVGASTGPSGTAIAVAEKLYDYAANGKWDKWQRVLKTEAGEWGRALLTPIRQVKDLIAAFDASQAITRDTSDQPFLGEIKESIPYADTDLPPAFKPTTAVPIHQERPGTKVTTGWRVITPKSFLERQLDELHFKSNEILSSTGDRQADAALKRAMGPLADELSAELERDAEFKRMSKAARAEFLREELSRIRKEARSIAEEEHPELFDQLKENRKPERQRKYEEELNSPGLSRAIELGVPMPIPPRLPGEDDIAYRARLLQVGRQRRARLDGAFNPALSMGQQRTRLHSALYS